MSRRLVIIAVICTGVALALFGLLGVGLFAM
jgi:hypothetical protein